MSHTCSFTSDDRGATEPYTDIPALGLVTIGVVLFGFLLASAYSSYAAKAYCAAERDDLRAIAITLAGDPSIACDGLYGVLDARKLDRVTGAPDPLKKYGRPGSGVSVRVEADKLSWDIGRPGKGRSVPYRLGLTVALNDARAEPGFMTVTVWEEGI